MWGGEKEKGIGGNTTLMVRWEFPGRDNPEGEANFRKLVLV